jgi:hypothetical protein
MVEALQRKVRTKSKMNLGAWSLRDYMDAFYGPYRA